MKFLKQKVKRRDHERTSMESLLKTLKVEKLANDAAYALLSLNFRGEIAKELFSNQVKNSKLNFKHMY